MCDEEISAGAFGIVNTIIHGLGEAKMNENHRPHRRAIAGSLLCMKKSIGSNSRKQRIANERSPKRYASPMTWTIEA